MSKNSLVNLPAIDTWRVSMGSELSRDLLALGSKNVSLPGPVLMMLIASAHALMTSNPNAFGPLKRAAMLEAIEFAEKKICA